MPKQKKEFLVIGSNNFWYASGLATRKEATDEIEDIIKHNGAGYGNPEDGVQPSGLPETFYIYEVKSCVRLDTEELK